MSFSVWLIVSLISAPVLSSLSLLFFFSSVLARLSTLCEAHRQGSLNAEEMRVFLPEKKMFVKTTYNVWRKTFFERQDLCGQMCLCTEHIWVFGVHKHVFTLSLEKKKKNIQRAVVAFKAAKNWDMLSKMYTLQF